MKNIYYNNNNNNSNFSILKKLDKRYIASGQTYAAVPRTRLVISLLCEYKTEIPKSLNFINNIYKTIILLFHIKQYLIYKP